MGNSPHTASIHILDDDSLLHIFYLYRPFTLGEDEPDNVLNSRLTGGERSWADERWWFKLAHVCQRWRNIILGSASYLSLFLVCTKGTPVADMLAHSPPLPLVIDYYQFRDITPEDEEGILRTLKQRDRVRRVRLRIPVTSLHLQELIMALDEEYPALEFLLLSPWIGDEKTNLVFPETFQAPHLRHLVLVGFALPIGSRLLTTAAGLVTLCLRMDHPSTDLNPNILLHWLSFMPQLENLVILFLFAVSNRDVQRQLARTPITTTITLPNLRYFKSQGVVSTYLEIIVRRIITPRLENLDIRFFNQLTFSVQRLQQFMNVTENLRFETAEFNFAVGQVYVLGYPREKVDDMHNLHLSVGCDHLDWQVTSVAQIFNSLSQAFASVEHLAFNHWEHYDSSEEHNEVDRIEWRNLLSLFSNVKTFRIDKGLVEELSRALELDDGERPLEVLPELQELTYSAGGNAGDAFNSFVDARQNAGRPVTLVRA